MSKILLELKNNLPSSDDAYINAIMDLINLFYLEVNDKIESADMMIEYINNADQNKNNFLSLNKIIK